MKSPKYGLAGTCQGYDARKVIDTLLLTEIQICQDIRHRDAPKIMDLINQTNSGNIDQNFKYSERNRLSRYFLKAEPNQSVGGLT